MTPIEPRGATLRELFCKEFPLFGFVFMLVGLFAWGEAFLLARAGKLSGDARR